MASGTVRVKEATRATLAQLSRETNRPMQDLLAEAVEVYRRDRILALTNEAYAALREDSEPWAEEQEERAAWDATLADGVEPE
jgi:hypothetical protein